MDDHRDSLVGITGSIVAGLALGLLLLVLLGHPLGHAADAPVRSDEFPFELPPLETGTGYPSLSDGFVDRDQQCARSAACLDDIYRVLEARLAERLEREFPHCWRTWSYWLATRTPHDLIMVVTVR